MLNVLEYSPPSPHWKPPGIGSKFCKMSIDHLLNDFKLLCKYTVDVEDYSKLIKVNHFCKNAGPSYVDHP